VSKTALLTGFGPFGSYERNPTESIVRELHGIQLSCGLAIYGEVLPSSYSSAPEILLGLIDKFSPDVILSLGYFSRAPRIRVESRGYNEMDSQYPDSLGVQYSGVTIDYEGPEYVVTTADNEALVKAIRLRGVDAELSTDAERFICNGLIYRITRARPEFTFGYLHTPTPESFADLIAGQSGKNRKILIPDDHLYMAVVTAIETMIG